MVGNGYDVNKLTLWVKTIFVVLSKKKVGKNLNKMLKTRIRRKEIKMPLELEA
jgi:hypothetical protein